MKVRFVGETIPVHLRSPEDSADLASQKARGYDKKVISNDVELEATSLPDPAAFFNHYGYYFSNLMNIGELVFISGGEIVSKLGGDPDIFHETCPFAFVVGSDVEVIEEVR